MLQENQVISRVGPGFEHSRAGASLLAAVAAPEEQIDLVAATINRAPGVNHNYAREHTYNLWFVMTAPDEETLEERLDELEHQLRLPILRLPMVEGYHIDLGFDIDWEALT
jgi:DNA-binding Lrp family transcriptional regulator